MTDAPKLDPMPRPNAKLPPSKEAYDFAIAAVRAAWEEAAGLCDAACKRHATATYENKDARMQNAAKTYAAGDLAEEIRALATDPDALARVVAKAGAGE
jgi:hypothetical protein